MFRVKTLLVFALVASLWTTTRLHGVDYSAVAMLGICLLLLSNVLNWQDLLAEHAAWDVFVWYGGMLRLAEALGETGITKRFAETAAEFTVTWKWGAALALLAVLYCYAHYAFASIYYSRIFRISQQGSPTTARRPARSTLVPDTFHSRRGGDWV